MRARVPADLSGERADLVVARLAEVSRAVAKQMILSGAVTVESEEIAPRDRLETGTVLEMEIPEPEPLLVPEDVAFEVLYEDDHLAVVNKPAGIVVHPGAGRKSGTLAAGLLHRWPRVAGVGDEGRWGIVHRLDRDTSGLLAVALDEAAYRGLREALERRAVSRVYRTVVHGGDIPPSGTIDAPLGRDPRHPTRFRVDREGRPARTHYRRLAVWENPAVSLLEVSLETGRTHQIRVHLSSIGHPVCGDPAYGRGGDGFPRVWLHAAHLAFTHPSTGEEVAVEAPLPNDLAASLNGLGDPVSGAVD